MTSVSVVIPTHNRPAMVRRATRSVLLQKPKPLEVLVVDDASSAEARELLTGLDFPGLRLIRREKSGGAGAARNTGAREARGDVILFLDDDDELLEGAVGVITSAFEDESLELSWGAVVRVDEARGEEIREPVWRPSGEDVDERYRSFILGRRIGTNCGVCIRRSSFRRIGGFDERLQAAEDTEFFLRAGRSLTYRAIEQPMVRVHIHTGPRLTTHDIRTARAYAHIIEKHQEVLSEAPGALWRYHRKAMWLFYRSNARRQARNHAWRALLENPLSLGTWALVLAYEILGPQAGGRAHDEVALLRKASSGWTSIKWR